MEQNIYDILSHMLLGTVTEKEMEQLDAWLEESEENRRTYASFMSRTDLKHVHDLGTTTQNRITSKSVVLLAVAMAASILLLIGFFWQGEDATVAPVLDTSTIAAITAAENSGHNDAEIILHKAGNEAEEDEVVNVGSDSILMALCSSVETEEEMTADIVTHHDKEFWMTLPDGTRVHLNYNTKLTYPLQFTGNAREVALEGEAYFFVAKDKRHPFIVHTHYGDIKEYGTEFNVSTRYDSRTSTGAYGIRGKGVAVVLVNGSISVITQKGTEHMLKPNDMAVMGNSGAPTVKQVDTAPFTAWNTGTFAFESCPLDRLMDVIGRWYGLEIEFKSDVARKMRFTGELDRYNDVRNDLEAISTITGLEIKAEGTKITIE